MNLFMGWLSLPSPLTYKMSLKWLDTFKMPCQKKKETFEHKPSFPSKGKEEKAPPSKESQHKKPLDDDVRRDLRRRKLCFTCQESLAPRHRCAAGKEHYIEVFLDDEEEE